MSKTNLALVLIGCSVFLAFPSNRSLSAKSSPLTSPDISAKSSDSFKMSNSTDFFESYKRFSRRLTTTVSTSYQSNFYRINDPNYQSRFILGLSFDYNLGNKQSLNLQMGGSFDVTDNNDSELLEYDQGHLADMLLIYGKKLAPLNDGLIEPSFGVQVQLPVSKESHSDQDMILGTALVGGLSLGLAKFNIPTFSPMYKISFSKNFHRYTTSASGEDLVSSSVKHSFGFSWNFFDKKFNVTYLWSIIQGWSYNSKNIPRYSNSLEMKYSITKKLFLNLGINEGQDVYKVNGADWNMKVFDRENTKAQIQAGVGYSF